MGFVAVLWSVGFIKVFGCGVCEALACVGFVALGVILPCAILFLGDFCGVVFVSGFGCLDSDFTGVGCVGFVLCVLDCSRFDCAISIAFVAIFGGGYLPLS